MDSFETPAASEAPAAALADHDIGKCIEETAHLRAALASRPVIDQAKGILIATHGCSPEDAFDMLCAASQRSNRKLRDIARDVVRSAQEVRGSRASRPAAAPG
jgi:two-component system, response regulator / RNA-binding antiterminator